MLRFYGLLDLSFPEAGLTLLHREEQHSAVNYAHAGCHQCHSE